jgi:hypothetical protein
MAKQASFTEEDDALLAELGVEVEAKKPIKYTKKEQRIIAGFEEIQRFVEEHGRAPRHGEDRDIFERLYAVRLDRIRAQKDCRELLEGMDHQALLFPSDIAPASAQKLSDDELLSELGVSSDDDSSITSLRHVKSSAEKKAAEEIANRTPCADFEQFSPLFEAVRQELNAGLRQTVNFHNEDGYTQADIRQDQFLIVGGQMAYVAKRGKRLKVTAGQEDARLRVIYANGTESNILLRSLVRAMYKDETSRFITDPGTPGPLFAGDLADDDVQSGTIYVLRSRSDHPTITGHREVIHKIGVTGGSVESRIANARKEATYLLADVEVVATYQLANIKRFKLEKVIHNFFEPARLDITIDDRFGHPVRVREWFLVPLPAIDEMVDKLKEGTILEYRYDPATGGIVRIA